MEFGETVYKQPLEYTNGNVNLLLISYEYRFIESLEKKRTNSIKTIQFTFCYIDDLISQNNTVCERYLKEIYAPELSLTKETLCVKEASYLDLFIAAKDYQFHTW